MLTRAALALVSAGTERILVEFGKTNCVMVYDLAD
jgi:hypothetical protein